MPSNLPNDLKIDGRDVSVESSAAFLVFELTTSSPLLQLWGEMMRQSTKTNPVVVGALQKLKGEQDRHCG